MKIHHTRGLYELVWPLGSGLT